MAAGRRLAATQATDNGTLVNDAKRETASHIVSAEPAKFAAPG